MIVRTLAILALLGLAACAPKYASPEMARIGQWIEAEQALSEANTEYVGAWTIWCDQTRRQPTGEVYGRNFCALERGRVRLMETQGGRARVVAPASIDSDLCGFGPDAHGVDGVSFNGRSFEAQLASLRAGRVYAREAQALWPSCAMRDDRVDLDGFEPAYQRFRAIARARGTL